MNDKVRAKALKTLDGMVEITKNEMLARGVYFSDQVVRRDLAESGALCGGRRACLIGSAWVAYGVKLDKEAVLPGTDEDERHQFLRNRPALNAVYKALNNAAQRKFDRDPDLVERDHESAAEALFEGNYGERINRTDILRLIASARREIVKA